MAETKISGLPAATGIVDADIVASSQDLSGTPITRKVTLAQIREALEVDENNIVYAGKHGNDANDGLTIAKAFLTIGAANTAALAMTPSSSNQIVVKITDAGEYVEPVTMSPFIHLDGENAKVTGPLVVADNSIVQLREIETSAAGILISKPNPDIDFSLVKIDVIRLTQASSFGVFNLSVTGQLIVQFSEIFVTGANSFGLGDLSGSQGHTHLFGNDIYLDADGASGLVVAGVTGSIIGNIDHIIEVGTHTGTIGLNVLGGVLDIWVNEISADTAITVAASATVNAILNKTSGTITNNGTLNILNVSGDSSLVNLSLTGKKIESVATAQVLVAGDTISVNETNVPVSGSAGPVISTAIPVISAGVDGETKKLIGTNDTNTYTITDDGGTNGLKLAGGAPFTLGAEDNITFLNYNSLWNEIGRVNT